MPGSRDFRQWEIWDVRWHHEDGTSKPRPALLLSPSTVNRGAAQLLFAKISSAKHDVPKRVELAPERQGFASTGLKKRCYVYLGDLRAVDKADVLLRRGRLTEPDARIMTSEITRRG